jgi:hypothetical protein
MFKFRVIQHGIRKSLIKAHNLWVDTRAYFTAATSLLNRYFLTGGLFMIGAFVVAFIVCFSLVSFGSNLSSSVGFPCYPKKLQAIMRFSSHNLSVIVGLLLRDGWVRQDKPH